MEPTGQRIQEIAATLDRLVEMARDGANPSFSSMVREAGLDPATDFVGADLSGIDFRDEDLTGFCLREADLTGTDFRRATGLTDDALDDAVVYGAIGLPESIEIRRGGGHRITPAYSPSP